jgi:hypothetical protein
MGMRTIVPVAGGGRTGAEPERQRRGGIGRARPVIALTCYATVVPE